MKPIGMLAAAALAASLFGNYYLYSAWQDDEQRIAKVKSVMEQTQQKLSYQMDLYRETLVKLKADHPLLFKDLQIPD